MDVDVHVVMEVGGFLSEDPQISKPDNAHSHVNLHGHEFLPAFMPHAQFKTAGNDMGDFCGIL